MPAALLLLAFPLLAFSAEVPIEQDETITTPIYSPNAPWSRAGVAYERFAPDPRKRSDTARPGLKPRWKVIGRTLYIEGDVIGSLVDQLVMQDDPIDMVYLNSYGGVAEAGRDLARIISERGMTTIVPAGGRCSSICTLLFQAGVRRLASRDADFMYHGVRAGSVEMKTTYRDVLEREGEEAARRLFFVVWRAKAVEGTDAMFRDLEAYGAGAALRADYFSLPDEPDYFERGNPLRKPDWHMGAAQAARYGVVTELFEPVD